MAIAAFGAYTWQGNQLTADIAFPALAYFNLLRWPMYMMPWSIVECISGKIALQRLQNFIDSEEADALTTPPVGAAAVVQ